MSERASELAYLKHFFDQADFGPADGDVRQIIADNFKKKTGLSLPEGYYDLDEEDEE